MLDQEQIKRIQPKLLLIQIVTAALIMGALVFTAVSSVIVDWENLNEQLKMLTLFAGASGLFIFVVSIFAPRLFAGIPDVTDTTNGPVNDPGVDAVVPMLITENLIRYALIEGGIFLNLMVLIIEPDLASLVVAGIGLLLMLVMFPRRSKLISTIEDRAEFPALVGQSLVFHLDLDFGCHASRLREHVWRKSFGISALSMATTSVAMAPNPKIELRWNTSTSTSPERKRANHCV